MRRVSVLTAVTVLVILYGALSRNWGVALAIGGSTSAGAALVHGNVVIYTFYAVACCAVLDAVARSIFRKDFEDLRKPEIPGMTLLITFTIWCVGLAVIAPALFNGLVTITPDHHILQAGRLSSSSIAQLVYLILGVAVFIILARDQRTGPRILGISLSIAMALSMWRYLSTELHVWFPEGVLDNAPTLTYIETAPGGVQRFRGIFSEPSALAGSALVAVVYGFARAAQVRGVRRVPPLLLVGAAAFLGVVSTSTTFIIAGAIIALILLALGAFEFVVARARIGLGTAIAGCLVVLALVWLAAPAARAVLSAFHGKVGTASFSERTDANVASYHVFAESWGLGVGLGSGRASSFIATLVSTTGIVGTALFVAAIAQIAFGALAIRQARPALWVLIALLVTKAVAGPDLSDTNGLLWMTLAVLAAARIRQDRSIREVESTTSTAELRATHNVGRRVVT